MSARDEIMARIGAALGPGVAAPEVPRGSRLAGSGPAAGEEAVVARFCELDDGHATARVVDRIFGP